MKRARKTKGRRIDVQPWAPASINPTRAAMALMDGMNNEDCELTEYVGRMKDGTVGALVLCVVGAPKLIQKLREVVGLIEEPK